MEKFKIQKSSFIIDGKEQFFICGEIHYFRMSPQYWEAALDRLVECGCNAVAYYVPWFVHEYEEDKYDFCGKVHESNNLHRWIKLTQEKGLKGFFRPGPYIYAESTDLGIPKWFTEKYPNVHIQTYHKGQYENTGLTRNTSHNHPVFIRYVEKWYTKVIKEIREYQEPKGNIIMFQLCNEIPGEDTDDRNRENLGIGNKEGLFPTYLTRKYGSIENLNKIYKSSFDKLENIEPHMLEEKNRELALTDHLDFYYTFYYPKYFKTLSSISKENGIEVPLVHNAYNPRAVSLHYHTKKSLPELNIGVDCYYSLTGKLGMKEATYYCDFGAEYIKRFMDNVPWVIEQECGYWNDYPVVYGDELYIWNIWTFAAGYKGMNMYLFASGENRKDMGFFGSDHNWQAPVNQYGQKNENFEHIKRSIIDIKENYTTLSLDNVYDIGFGIKNKAGLIWRNISKVTSDAFFALKSCGFTPKICDFEALSLKELKQYKSLWIVSDAYMEEEIQEKLCHYVKNGGKLIIQGTVPYKDYEEQPCSLLADFLGIQVREHVDVKEDQLKLELEGKEYFVGRSIQKIETNKENILAFTTDCSTPAILNIIKDQGHVLLMPFAIDILFNSQLYYIQYALDKMGILPAIEGANRLRVIPKENNKFVILNLHPIEIEEKIKIFSKEYNIHLKPYSFTTNKYYID